MSKAATLKSHLTHRHSQQTIEMNETTTPTPADDATTKNADQLALYYSPFCGYCVRVMRVIEDLGIDVEMRSTLEGPAHYSALVQARNRATVPVLWIKSRDGSVHWMPESRDIINYLQERFG